jgi:hypothetical protein
MAVETQYTAQLGIQQVTLANSNLDGTTGSYSSAIVTGASSGTLLTRVKVKATVQTTEGMVRLFVTGGGTTKMILEIPVDAVKPDSNDEAFERTVDLNFALQSGYSVKGSTQNSEAMNVIIEGLDWTYYTSAVRPESTKYTANTGITTISAANTSLTGSGTINVDIWNVITAGASATYKGCLIENVIIKSTAFASGTTTTPGMVRLFVFDGGSTTRLLTEIKVPPVTQSGTLQSFYRKVPLNFNLQAGYSIRATTEKGDSFAVIAEGKDWNYPSATSGTNFTAGSITNTLTETKLSSIQIPANVLTTGDVIRVYANTEGTNSGNAKTFRIYINNADSLSGATLLSSEQFTTQTCLALMRLFPVISDTSLRCYSGTTTSAQTQYNASTGASADTTVPSVSTTTTLYIVISGQMAALAETATVRWAYWKKDN